MKFWVTGAAVLCGLMPLELMAGPISASGFGAGAVVEGYESMHPGGNVSVPMVLNGHTYTSDGAQVSSHINGGPKVGATGNALSTITDLAYIDVALASPAFRVGVFAGSDSTPGLPKVEFFDSSDALLATLFPGPSLFVGYETGGNAIARIRITDTASDGLPVLLDNLTIEVPEPAVVGLLVAAACVNLSRSRRRH
ncbi:MAG TPA: hypothetical protein VEA69_22355 [Tepidisphaeraceae bacterium]|nr:hypothetical protein [Tepidisphaeraceae bacterium]